MLGKAAEPMREKNDANIERYITSKQGFMKIARNKQIAALSAQIEALKESKETPPMSAVCTARFRAKAAFER